MAATGRSIAAAVSPRIPFFILHLLGYQLGSGFPLETETNVNRSKTGKARQIVNEAAMFTVVGRPGFDTNPFRKTASMVMFLFSNDVFEGMRTK
ncbi:hypothetical protein [Marinobacter daqiaonensis]|uniref:hypothetical protein n=1 Tax=Marinobacter daqiaonensis TaxID=650891 RepID=UPI0011137D12|nr:hypothetical protein [Marinobacter daqiaonensis]